MDYLEFQQVMLDSSCLLRIYYLLAAKCFACTILSGTHKTLQGKHDSYLKYWKTEGQRDQATWPRSNSL